MANRSVLGARRRVGGVLEAMLAGHPSAKLARITWGIDRLRHASSSSASRRRDVRTAPRVGISSVIWLVSPTSSPHRAGVLWRVAYVPVVF